MRDEAGRYRWFVAGDINGFFGLMFDNLTVLSFLAGILVFAFGFPSDIVYTRMFPGTAFGVLFGDLVYTVMAFRLARRTGRTTVTAMPLGLDTPSTDLFKSKGLEAHKRLFARGMVNLEGLVLDHVRPGAYILVALPLRLEGADASPVRAVLLGN